MTDEEKKAIKIIQKEIKELEMEIKACEENRDVDEPELAFYIQQKEAKETLLNLIRKQSKVIDEILKAWKQDDVRSIEELKQYFYGKVERRWEK